MITGTPLPQSGRPDFRVAASRPGSYGPLDAPGEAATVRALVTESPAAETGFLPLRTWYMP
jgi:hypothetical protein